MKKVRRDFLVGILSVGAFCFAADRISALNAEFLPITLEEIQEQLISRSQTLIQDIPKFDDDTAMNNYQIEKWNFDVYEAMKNVVDSTKDFNKHFKGWSMVAFVDPKKKTAGIRLAFQTKKYKWKQITLEYEALTS